MKKSLLITSLFLLVFLFVIFLPTKVYALEDNEEQTEEIEIHKVQVITTKVDEEGNPLSGATLEIIDSEGNIVDSWISDGLEHATMLPEGEYTLREVLAPVGYELSVDQNFTVEVKISDINAGVDHNKDSEVCKDYGGIAFYYVESEGVKEETYCINQGLKEPNNISYDGEVLTPENIRDYAPDADPNMTDKDLYNKVLDIVNNRTNADEEFSDLTEEEIRFITEYALKTYTSSEVTNEQAMRDENGKIIRDDEGNIVYEDVKFLKQYRYVPESRTGYVEDRGNGDGFGKLAQHWWTGHGHKKIPARYAEFFYYLISNEVSHPVDMHLYVYTTTATTADGENYQNLLGIKWFNPYDENYKVNLEMVNIKRVLPDEEEPEEDTPEEQLPKRTVQKKTAVEITPPKTGLSTNSENNCILIILLTNMLLIPVFRRVKE